MYSHLSCISKPIDNYQLVTKPDVYVKGTGVKHKKCLKSGTQKNILQSKTEEQRKVEYRAVKHGSSVSPEAAVNWEADTPICAALGQSTANRQVLYSTLILILHPKHWENRAAI